MAAAQTTLFTSKRNQMIETVNAVCRPFWEFQMLPRVFLAAAMKTTKPVTDLETHGPGQQRNEDAPFREIIKATLTHVPSTFSI